MKVVQNFVPYLEFSVNINFTSRTCNSLKGSCKKKKKKMGQVGENLLNFCTLIISEICVVVNVLAVKDLGP